MIIGAFFSGAWKMARKIPWQLWAVVALAVALWFAYHSGQKNVQHKWDAANKAQKQAAQQVKAGVSSISTKIVTQVKYRVRTIEKAGKERTVIREVFVPRDSGNLSGAFRLYYDAAVTGTVPSPASIPNATPVPIADVAANIDANYDKCNKAYAVVKGWQDYSAGVQAEIAKANENAGK